MDNTLLVIAIILLGINVGIGLIMACIGQRRHENNVSVLPKGFSNELINLYRYFKFVLDDMEYRTFERGKEEGILEGKRLKEEEKDQYA